MKRYVVYCHVFPNGKRYVGITSQSTKRRWQNGEGYKGQVVYNSIQKYGWHNIEHNILYENLTKLEAEKKEIEIIKEWKTNDRKYGYNVESGGNLNKEVSKETKLKLSESHKGQIPWIKGRKHTDYSNELNRQKHLGKTAWNKGKVFGDSSKNKMSVSKKKLYENGWLPSNTKKVICLETGIIYNSAREAGRLLNLSSAHISSCCTGNRKSTGGFHFQHFEGGDEYGSKH